jgi:redox-sensitive bicupin YhaK (pirin superfamily)
MPIVQLIDPPARDLGDGFLVQRALPTAALRSVGPFVFVDHFGPVRFAPGQGLDVRPHPHIGLATVTYLFEGEITHRDSLGHVRSITPGAVNWMVAGRGIVHSERTGSEARAAGHRLWGMQTWLALPEAGLEAEPAFEHHPAATLPSFMLDGARRTLVLGTAFGAASPVPVPSPVFYLDVDAQAGAVVRFPEEHAERALFLAAGAVELEGQRIGAGQLALVAPGGSPALRALQPSRAMLLGGAPLGPRLLWWNFVGTRAQRLARASEDWRAGRFPTVPGETEWIPLPDAPPLPTHDAA